MKKCFAAWMMLVVMLLGSSAHAVFFEPNPTSVEITEQCIFTVSEGSASKLHNGVRSLWEYGTPGAKILVELPEAAVPGAIVIYWQYEPFGYTVEEYDEQKNVLRARDLSDYFPSIVSYYDLLPQTRYVALTMTAMNQAVADLKLYSAGTHDEYVQMWQAPVEKADLMVVSTHQDDELIFFGGTIPYYDVAMDRPTIVVYMADCSRYRRQEALSGLWAMGVRTYPEFINLKDARLSSLEESMQLWGGKENILRELVQRIRRYKPEVIVTHDFDGEYGHNQHKATSRSMQAAIDAAADPARFPESAAQYGTWKVKKLYIHLYGENQVCMDWKTPLEELGGISPLLAAQVGYAEHASQHKYYQVEEGGQYDNALFGLFSSDVGPDVLKNDFLENIVAPTPVPEPTMEPAAEEQPVPETVPVSESEPEEKKGSAAGWLIGAAVVLISASAAVLYCREMNRRRRRRRRAQARRSAPRSSSRRVD